MTAQQWDCLPEIKDWRERFSRLAHDDGVSMRGKVTLAGCHLDFIRINSLDEVVLERGARHRKNWTAFPSVSQSLTPQRFRILFRASGSLR